MAEGSRVGLFTHYLAHMLSRPVPEDATPAAWNKRVNAFDTAGLAQQLEQVKAPYFFITLGQAEEHYCVPSDKLPSF